MIIKSLKISHLQLFKSAEINPAQINFIRGTNFDNLSNSSNGSGKTTLFKTAIIFTLYGEGYGKKLNKLIRFNSKEAIVTVELYHNQKTYIITRKIPSALTIVEDGKELQFNTPTIAQTYLNNLFGDYDFFKKYCLIDDKAINVLDSLKDIRSIVSFKNELIDFIAKDFTPIRESLLKKKNDRELYSIDKRLYKFHLSKKRLEFLENKLRQLKEEENTAKKDREEQQETANKIHSEIVAFETKISGLKTQNEKNKINKKINSDDILGYDKKIKSLKNEVYDLLKIIDYDSQIKTIEKELEIAQKDIVEYGKEEVQYEQIIEQTTLKLYDLEIVRKHLESENIKLNKEIVGLDEVKIGTKCDRCGSLVSQGHKEKYKEEKTNLITGNKTEIAAINNKNLIEQSIKDKNKNELDTVLRKKYTKEKSIETLHSQLKSINNKKFSQAEEVKKIEQQSLNRDASISRYEEMIKSAGGQRELYEEQIISNNQEIEQLYHSIEQAKTQLKEAGSTLTFYNSLYDSMQSKINKCENYIMKLSEAFRFSEYKYSKTDIQLYADSIKTIDTFSGDFIREWLNNLMMIINDLLKPLNLSIELTEEKEFIKIRDGKEELTYDLLSSGQICFLSAIFKLGILLQKGETNKIIVMDDGLGAMDIENFKNLIEVCRNLPMQYFIIYQNCPELPDVNYVNIERKNGESKLND